MEIFTNVKSLLAASGIFPSASGDRNDKLSRLVRNSKVFVFCTVFYGFYSLTFVYSVKYLRTMEAIQAAGYINNGVLCVGIGYTTLVYNRNLLLDTIRSWEQAVANRMQAKPSSEKFYQQGTANMAKIFKRVSIFYLCLTVSIFITTVIVVPIVNLLYGNFDPTTWIQVYDAFIFPFARDSYLTFFGKNLTVFITTLCYYTVIASSMLILMTTCVCYEACIDDFLDDIQSSNPINWVNDSYCTKYFEVERKLVDAIRYQNRINEHLARIAQILSGIIFLSILNAVTTMALALFILKKWNYIELREMSAHVVTSFDIFLIQTIICLIYCYFGNVITSKSMEISNIAYAIEWYRLHPRIQMIIKLIILRSQREIYFSGFSIIVCSLEMFKKVIDSALSYYLIVRSVSLT